MPVPNPIQRIRRDSGITRKHFDNFFELSEGGFRRHDLLQRTMILLS